MVRTLSAIQPMTVSKWELVFTFIFVFNLVAPNCTVSRARSVIA